METVIASLIEKSLVGGAFVYMLHYFLNRFSGTLESVSTTLMDISGTLVRINTRLDSVERRLDKLEGGDKD